MVGRILRFMENSVNNRFLACFLVKEKRLIVYEVRFPLLVR